MLAPLSVAAMWVGYGTIRSFHACQGPSQYSMQGGTDVIHTRAVPDPILGDPRLAELYDVIDDDRSDLDVYAEIVGELKPSMVLDGGCGTGTFACMLVQRGIEVIGLDPASASLDVARRKPGASEVSWIHGEASSAPALGADLAVMTATSLKSSLPQPIGARRSMLCEVPYVSGAGLYSRRAILRGAHGNSGPLGPRIGRSRLRAA